MGLKQRISSLKEDGQLLFIVPYNFMLGILGKRVANLLVFCISCILLWVLWVPVQVVLANDCERVSNYLEPRNVRLTRREEPIPDIFVECWCNGYQKEEFLKLVIGGGLD